MATCGNCHRVNVSVEHVRNCYFERYAKAETAAAVAEAEKIEEAHPVSLVSLVSLGVAPSTGVFVRDGIIYKVQVSPATGRFYTKVWNDGSWAYAGIAPLWKLTESHRISAEEAGEWGRTHGQCVFCARGLTDERSMFVGYGAICAEHNGLPWGERPAGPEINDKEN